jgi:uncharacterized integral membrane protein (TIGR00697 family)
VTTGRKEYRYFPLLCGLFVTCLLTSNLLSSAKIVDLGLEVFSIAFVLDAGTLLFPVCYIIGDLLAEVYGYKKTRKIIWIGFFCSIIFTLSVYIVGLLSPEQSWQQRVGQQSYNQILGGIASGGIIIASLLAYLFGEFSNAMVLSKLKVFTAGKWFALRAIGSSVVGQFLDSFIFLFVASIFGVFPWELFWHLLVSIFVIKLAIEIAITPLTYLIAKFLKKAEQEDFYDKKTSFFFFKTKTSI